MTRQQSELIDAVASVFRHKRAGEPQGRRASVAWPLAIGCASCSVAVVLSVWLALGHVESRGAHMIQIGYDQCTTDLFGPRGMSYEH